MTNAVQIYEALRNEEDAMWQATRGGVTATINSDGVVHVGFSTRWGVDRPMLTHNLTDAAMFLQDLAWVKEQLENDL